MQINGRQTEWRQIDRERDKKGERQELMPTEWTTDRMERDSYKGRLTESEKKRDRFS
jgi:hypothetical protein